MKTLDTSNVEATERKEPHDIPSESKVVPAISGLQKLAYFQGGMPLQVSAAKWKDIKKLSLEPTDPSEEKEEQDPFEMLMSREPRPELLIKDDPNLLKKKQQERIERAIQAAKEELKEPVGLVFKLLLDAGKRLQLIKMQKDPVIRRIAPIEKMGTPLKITALKAMVGDPFKMESGPAPTAAEWGSSFLKRLHWGAPKEFIKGLPEMALSNLKIYLDLKGTGLYKGHAKEQLTQMGMGLGALVMHAGYSFTNPEYLVSKIRYNPEGTADVTLMAVTTVAAPQAARASLVHLIKLKDISMLRLAPLLRAGPTGGIRRNLLAWQLKGFRTSSARFYTVQGAAEIARLKGMGKPWPTAASRAHLGPGVYSWDKLSTAQKYLKIVKKNYPEANVEIVAFRVKKSHLHKFKTFDVRTLTDDQATAFMNKYSGLWTDRPDLHGYQYVIRATNVKIGPNLYAAEHYFTKDLFKLLRFPK